jgi:hypothetical protein
MGWFHTLGFASPEVTPLLSSEHFTLNHTIQWA